MKKFKKIVTKDFILYRNTFLTFGKHVSKTCGEVADLDPEYILWLDTNKEYTVSESLRIKAEEAKEWTNIRDFTVWEEMNYAR